MALRIKALREAKGWTQADLAERSGMSRSQLAMIEKETRPANTLRLNAIADALGVTPEELFSESDIVSAYRRLSADDQRMVLQLAESLAARSRSAD